MEFARDQGLRNYVFECAARCTHAHKCPARVRREIAGHFSNRHGGVRPARLMRAYTGEPCSPGHRRKRRVGCCRSRTNRTRGRHLPYATSARASSSRRRSASRAFPNRCVQSRHRRRRTPQRRRRAAGHRGFDTATSPQPKPKQSERLAPRSPHSCASFCGRESATTCYREEIVSESVILTVC